LTSPDREVEIENGRPPFHDDEIDYAIDEDDVPHKLEESSIYTDDIELEYRDENFDQQPPTILMGHSGEEG